MHMRNEQQAMISDSFTYDEGDGERMHAGKNAAVHPTHLIIQNKGGRRKGEGEQERGSKGGVARARNTQCPPTALSASIGA